MANSMRGFTDLEDLFLSLVERVPNEYESVLKNAARVVESAALNNINDGKTGNLRESVAIEQYKSKGIINYRVIAGGKIAPHAHLVEFGHRIVNKSSESDADVPAHPFLRKAFDDNKSSIEKAMSDAIDKVL